ncbi:rpsu-divergently transcribed protein [Plasmopara halstedii]|uniref:Ubiquinone biosynthesis protein n=1 Tax=Plasmopara halstedii TaxID=4781 RepID=A0A0P1AQ00_PLAHL|nr:rpsu-divergently transcribed protein [Plasmopara halstedii]CEG43181.1 rpsu-divergently transcribed protein [Plasmopara halstedii]|eukprot:XP_024579550.1 rpsu-divergently transcribed protein [Plasmopara halstedii]
MMASSRGFIRRSVFLATALASKRSTVHTASVSFKVFQHLQVARTFAQNRLQSTQTTAGNEERPQSESSVDLEQRILAKTMDNVPVHGWTVEALAAGAIDLGYPSVAHGMFSRGAIELVDYFMDTCLNKLRETLINNTEKLQAMTVAERLKFGVRTRLEMLEPVLATWPQGMAIGAFPQNAPGTAKRLAKLSDEIWYFAGDKSTDLSWYTKRAILSAIYASTELFMLNDKSPNRQETWEFLDRRVDETISLGELPQNLNDALIMANIGLQSVFSAVTSLAGPLQAKNLWPVLASDSFKMARVKTSSAATCASDKR